MSWHFNSNDFLAGHIAVYENQELVYIGRSFKNGYVCENINTGEIILLDTTFKSNDINLNYAKMKHIHKDFVDSLTDDDTIMVLTDGNWKVYNGQSFLPRVQYKIHTHNELLKLYKSDNTVKIEMLTDEGWIPIVEDVYNKMLNLIYVEFRCIKQKLYKWEIKSMSTETEYRNVAQFLRDMGLHHTVFMEPLK